MLIMSPNLFEGDIEIFEKSSILKHIQPGDVILAA